MGWNRLLQQGRKVINQIMMPVASGLRQEWLWAVLPRTTRSYLAAGPVCCAAVAWECRRACIWTLALWASMAAVVPLVACLPVGAEPAWTVKILPMSRPRPAVDPPEVDPPALDLPDVALPEPAEPLEVALPEVAGPCCLGAAGWHALLHSAMVIKLLLLPWQPPYQNCWHLAVMTS